MSDQIQITLPDSSSISVAKGTTVFEAIGTIGKGLQNAALAAVVNGNKVDLSAVLEKDSHLSVITFDSQEGRDVLWHSASHLMAQAIKRLYKDAVFAIGPAVDSGFYYDIDLEQTLSVDDLEKIEAEMEKIVQEDLPVKREMLSRQDAIDKFTQMGEQYKVEMLNEITDATVSVYTQGEFTDLCRGPHVPSTGKIKAFKLIQLAGAYWRGDENNKMLQRVYGVAFPDKKALKKHLNLLEEAKKRDHRKLGKELDLFSIQEEVGAGLVLWHPKGTYLKNTIERFWRDEHYKNGYEMISTPHIGKSGLWETSGHLDFYNENMYSSMDVDGQDYYAKPMNCPFHLMIYKSKGYSYRELPLRWAELGTVYRYERSGVLHGLLRVRGFTQDDAHLVCRPDQMPDEIDRVLEFCLKMLRSFGFNDFKIYLATKPKEKSVGDESAWKDATLALEEAVKRAGAKYYIDEGGGAFYGPKIDVKITDALGREWQCSTIQFDFNLPERFNMSYIDKDGQKHQPYMIHRALLGSLERFIGVLIEHYAGKFPVWLSPVQAVLINVSENEAEFVTELQNKMRSEDMRIDIDTRNESIGYKVRDAIKSKVPYIAVIGKKEVAEGKVALRKRGEDKAEPVAIGEFISLIKDDVKELR